MKYVKFISEDQVAGFDVDATDQSRVESLLLKGFLPLEEQEKSLEELLPTQSRERKYINHGDRVVAYYRVQDNSPQKLVAMIDSLRECLAETDYRVIKNREYADAGLEPSYDPVALHQERETIREQIRELEAVMVDNQ